MELREWALRILSGTELEDKLFDPGILSDEHPGPARFFDEPTRGSTLKLSRRALHSKLPPFHEHDKRHARISCLHRFCGHELLAVELLAFALLAYPQAPKAYRRSLAHHLREEQAHVELYRKRLIELGSDLGQEPLHRHFWSATGYLHTHEHFISFMNLTIEQANLDFAPIYLASFLRHGDLESAQVMQTILRDEIGHVRLGMHWLKRYHPQCDDTQLYEQWQQHAAPNMSLDRARGFTCYRAPRLASGIPSLWIDQICPKKEQQNDLPLERLLAERPLAKRLVNTSSLPTDSSTQKSFQIPTQATRA